MHSRAKSLAISFTLANSIAVIHAAAETEITIGPGDPVPSFTDLAMGATVNVIDDGTIGRGVDLSNGTLNISGGSVALGATGISPGFTNFNNTVNVTGGQVGPFFQLAANSNAFFSGGTLNTFGVFSNSTATASGSTITGFADVFNTGTFIIEGGNVSSFRALAGSNIEIVGTEFFLGGNSLDIAVGESIVLSDRNQLLEVTLADGSAFEHPLLSANLPFPTPGVALNSATITLSRVPTPGGSVVFAGMMCMAARRRQ